MTELSTLTLRPNSSYACKLVKYYSRNGLGFPSTGAWPTKQKVLPFRFPSPVQLQLGFGYLSNILVYTVFSDYFLIPRGKSRLEVFSCCHLYFPFFPAYLRRKHAQDNINSSKTVSIYQQPYGLSTGKEPAGNTGRGIARVQGYRWG